ncbi:MAG: hypothetical protein M3015_02810 [Bacteroidota bacterium]|nr:hypothetical protein [Bacteroidota bacterium]
MSTKKIILITIFGALVIAGILDAIRYLKPAKDHPEIVLPAKAFSISAAKKIILVYNAWGGIYPGIADIIHKEFFPATYPCNLCFISFGTFGMKDEWKHFLDSLAYQKIELHKDRFKRNYQPEDMRLPAILLNDESKTEVLLSAAEINKLHTLTELINAVRNKLQGE